MHYRDIDWAAYFNSLEAPFHEHFPKEVWDSKAAGFTRKPTHSGYIAQLLPLLKLEPGESVFDMGCGSGTVALPLAQAGHPIIAVDFSPAMLAELNRVADEEGVASLVQTHERAWEEPWDDLPQADVALSSRSFIVKDLPDAIGKLESKARRKVVLSIGATDLPYRDRKMLASMGRGAETPMEPEVLVAIVNYLFALGRLPSIEYITQEHTWFRETQEELEQTILENHRPRNDAERDALLRFTREHIVYNLEKNRFEVDYPRIATWAVISWAV